jgi:hypothetical protein
MNMETLTRCCLYVWVCYFSLLLLWKLWMWHPALLLGFGVLVGVVAAVFYREHRRCKGEGFYVEYLSPGLVRDGPDDWGVVYREGENALRFYGKIIARDRDILHVPSLENWLRIVPEWARDRREIILQRILHCMHPERVHLVEE